MNSDLPLWAGSFCTGRGHSTAPRQQEAQTCNSKESMQTLSKALQHRNNHKFMTTQERACYMLEATRTLPASTEWPHHISHAL